MDYACNLQEEAYFLGPYEPMLIKQPPRHSLKMMYIDWAPGARCAMDSFGADHFIFGTDARLKPLKKAGVDIIKSLKPNHADEARYSRKTHAAC